MKHREVRIHAEFKGEVSPENRRWLVRRVATRAALSFLAVMLPLMLIVSLIMVWEWGWEECDWAVTLFVGISLLFSLLVFALSFTKREQKELFPTRAVFYADRDHTVIFDCPKRRLELYREDIRRMVDMGAYYYLDIPAQSGRGMVCQKDLMTIGTEEAFEKLFEGKIERKQK
ncbi:MAG: magnesium transporter [Clostridia bacterium]|nr:magnesium transporter [Clostridia bacterium]